MFNAIVRGSLANRLFVLIGAVVIMFYGLNDAQHSAGRRVSRSQPADGDIDHGSRRVGAGGGRTPRHVSQLRPP